MTPFRWRHGRPSAADAREAIQAVLRRAGYDGTVTWTGDRFAASAGLGLLFSATGAVTDAEVIVETCGGAMAGTVLQHGKEILRRLFPGGEVA